MRGEGEGRGEEKGAAHSFLSYLAISFEVLSRGVLSSLNPLGKRRKGKKKNRSGEAAVLSFTFALSTAESTCAPAFPVSVSQLAAEGIKGEEGRGKPETHSCFDELDSTTPCEGVSVDADPSMAGKKRRGKGREREKEKGKTRWGEEIYSDRARPAGP